MWHAACQQLSGSVHISKILIGSFWMIFATQLVGTVFDHSVNALGQDIRDVNRLIKVLNWLGPNVHVRDFYSNTFKNLANAWSLYVKSRLLINLFWLISYAIYDTVIYIEIISRFLVYIDWLSIEMALNHFAKERSSRLDLQKQLKRTSVVSVLAQKSSFFLTRSIERIEITGFGTLSR